MSARAAPGEWTEALGEYAAGLTQVLIVAHLDEHGRIISANGSLQRLAGSSLAGAHVCELVSPAQRPALEQALASGDGDWQRLILGLGADEHGVPSDFAVSLRRLPDGWLMAGEPIEAAISVVNRELLDLNDELARAQRRIRFQNAQLERHNDRLRELDRLKDELLANVSHDLRTPLTAILGYAELMRRRGGLPPKQAQATEIIERNARRLLRLVNDLLLLAQARAGALALELEPVDLAGVAADAVELAQPLADQAAVQLLAELPGRGSTVIAADRLRLAQLLDNLIANALKFTPAGRHVAVRAGTAGDGTPFAEVADEGPGIPEEERERLFEPFARGSASDGRGAGLGLAIVRAVADAHEATIELDSPGGQGTRFRIWFPGDRPATNEAGVSRE